MPFELRVDCSSCRVEGARVELWDSGAAPVEHRCRLCGASGTPCTQEQLERALGAWAKDEGLASAQELLEAFFVLRTPAEVFAAMQRGEVVETTFDVIDYLFSSGAGAGGAAAVERAVLREEAVRPSVHPTIVPASLRRVGGPRDELLALASVAAADGDAGEGDREMLQRAAERRGIPPLAVEDIRVRRPAEIDPPATLVQREALLKEMFWMAWNDGELDESELRVVRAFARAWGVDPQRVQEWTDVATMGDANALERWVTRIGRYLFPGW